MLCLRLDKHPHPQLILQRPPPIVSMMFFMRLQRNLKLSQPQHRLRIAPRHLNGHHQVLHKRSRTDLLVVATRTVRLHRGIELGSCWRFGSSLELFRWCYLVR